MVDVRFVMGRIGPDGVTAVSKDTGLVGSGKTLVEAMADLRKREAAFWRRTAAAEKERGSDAS